MNGAASSYASIDYSTLHNGDVSIRLGPDFVRGTREVDGVWVNVHPGDHIVFSCWIKTAAFSGGDSWIGARTGVDFYIHSNLGYGIATVDSQGHQAGLPNDAQNVAAYNRVLPGHDWTLVTWDIYVPTTFYSYVTYGPVTGYGVYSCNAVQIDSMVPWIDAREQTYNYNAWFSDMTFYVNP
jgi:hypothetical protein